MTHERLVELVRMVNQSPNWEVVMYHLKITPEETIDFIRALEATAAYLKVGFNRYTGHSLQ